MQALRVLAKRRENPNLSISKALQHLEQGERATADSIELRQRAVELKKKIAMTIVSHLGVGGKGAD